MIPVNSVLQVGQFPEVMQAAIDRRITPVRFPDLNANLPSGSFESILIRSNTQLPAQLLEKLPAVKMVATCGVGYDNLPLDYLKANGIKAGLFGGKKTAFAPHATVNQADPANDSVGKQKKFARVATTKT